MFADIQAKLETLKMVDERLSKVKVRFENHNKRKKEPDPKPQRG